MSDLLLVGLGGVVGAVARYVVTIWAAGRFGTAFPFGTLIVNLAGSLLVGFFLGAGGARFGDDPAVRLLVATGFLGALTTFSTFAAETVALVGDRDYAGAARNVLGTIVLGPASAAVGLALAAVAAGSW